MFVMIVRMNGLCHLALVDQMRAPNAAVQTFTEHLRIEAGQGQAGAVVVVEEDAEEGFNEDMHSNSNRRRSKIRG